MMTKQLFPQFPREEVPILGLGCGALGLRHQNMALRQYDPAPGWTQQADLDLAVETVLAAIDGGIRFIDVAPWYGRGLSEIAVGKALSMRPDLKDHVVVATKIGRISPDDEYDFSYDAAMRSFEGSQERLGIQSFLLVNLHDPMKQPVERVMKGAYRAMSELQRRGLIIKIGIGANDPATAAEYIKTGQFDAAIVVGSWSLLNQSAADRIIPAALRYGMSLFAANALERGILATGYQPDLAYQERNFAPEIIARVETIKALCARHGISLAAAAIQWCVRREPFVIAMPGARTPEQARQNIAAGNEKIPPDLWTELEPLVATWDYALRA